ncbi:8-amino-7-oxononanoate synthase [Coxiella endosymbiont of Amblyomma sculptum]|uniref:aminotransferase class I/II-fold pyridoxal phosphate-dependent enzyme n=1 Tax=Coxiella endosymbiont of Amblyomma sculptum TaxID=2487929 RepID=UPI00132F2D2D|nr:8-amino-7-oxononanoate synthase [Coxiella endosymbiont of Amblyomma sculptum]QHG92596.1 8-amino-7-oxononanoate synthase [Coxiella endosymbiont of Amblyomma sculptum]
MLIADIKSKLSRYEQSSLLRERLVVEKKKSRNRVIVNGLSCISFCSNDYLGLTDHPAIKEAFIQGIRAYGVGSGSSALVSGYFKPQKRLEEKFSEFLLRDQSIFFNSGYAANLGVITSLNSRKNTVLSDKFCHISLLEAVRLSRARHYRFKHNNLEHFKYLLCLRKPNMVITEGIFSMEGDSSPLSDINHCISGKDIALVVDDAHGIGILGKNGGGSCEKWGLTQLEVPCLILPLGKAFGCTGAVVSGKEDFMKAILQFANSYRTTTALPPAVCVAILKSIDIIRTESWRRKRLAELIHFFTEETKNTGLSLISYDETPIRCFLVANNKKIRWIQERMLKKGFFISCIRPPSVPDGKARIRISLNCFHTEKQIIQLLDHLSYFLC